MARRPYRTQFFAGFVAGIRDQFSQSVSLLELGSGPGHLADRFSAFARSHDMSRWISRRRCTTWRANGSALGRTRSNLWNGIFAWPIGRRDLGSSIAWSRCKPRMKRATSGTCRIFCRAPVNAWRQAGCFSIATIIGRRERPKSATGCKRRGTAHRVVRCGLHARGEAFGHGRHGFDFCNKFKLLHYRGNKRLATGNRKEAKTATSDPVAQQDRASVS